MDSSAYVFSCLQEGDIGPVYKKYYPILVTYLVMLRLVIRQDAEEIVDDVFLKLLYMRKSYFKDLPHVYCWLLVVARNQATDYFRRGKVHRVLVVPPGTISPVPDLELVELETIILRALQDSVEGLPDRCRQVIKSRLANLTTAEIAASMEISTNTVRAQLRRGIDLLKTIFNNLHLK